MTSSECMLWIQWLNTYMIYFNIWMQHSFRQLPPKSAVLSSFWSMHCDIFLSFTLVCLFIRDWFIEMQVSWNLGLLSSNQHMTFKLHLCCTIFKKENMIIIKHPYTITVWCVYHSLVVATIIGVWSAQWSVKCVTICTFNH